MLTFQTRIYKAKYNDDTPKEPKKKLAERGRSSTDREPKARKKSRSRNMFGRKNPHAKESEPRPLP
jgi:hypothetical protein